ncbi:MAG: sugar phosphate isomerase/epimerase, partial [Chloroflexi bacterium]|nr:sugar phosphate isomerase/epimerase [Chloroflexota bacterium]
MKLGFLTACMPERPLSEVVHFASAHGYQTLEVACWPRTSERDYNASHIDVTTLDHAGADEIQRMCELSGLSISALAYYENNLAADPNERAVVNGHLRKVIDAAALLGVGLVGTFVGHDLSKTAAENGDEAVRVFGELTDYAGQKDVRLMIENCPMVGWQQPWTPGNLCYAPEQWDALFAAVPALGLNLDPSHLYWLGVDPYALARAYGAHILHAHAKDTEVLRDKHARIPILDGGWWRYRMPGLGEIDWPRFISALQEGGYDG